MTASTIPPTRVGQPLAGGATTTSSDATVLPVAQQPANAQVQLTPNNEIRIQVAELKSQITSALSSLSIPANANAPKLDALAGPVVISRISDSQALVSSIKAHNVSVVLAATEKSQVLGELSRALSSVRALAVQMPVTVVSITPGQVTINAATLARPVTLPIPVNADIHPGPEKLTRHTQSGNWSLNSADLSTPLPQSTKASISKALTAHALKSPGLVFENLPPNTVKQLTTQLPKLTTSLAQPQVGLSFNGSQFSATTAVWQPSVKLLANTDIFKGLVPNAPTKVPALPELRIGPAALTERPPTLSVTDASLSAIPKTVLPSDAVLNSLPGNQTQHALLQQQIPQLARKLLADTGSTHQALSQLLGLLKGGSPSSPESADVLAKITTQLSDEALFSKPAIVPAASTDTAPAKPSPFVAQLQAIFAATTLPVTPTTLQSSAPPSNFVAALVSLLQISFGAKAMSRADSTAKVALQQNIANNSITSNTGPTGAALRAGFDVNSQDKQGQLTTALKTLLANHQATKLTNAEVRLQGQEQFYFILPFASQGRQAPEVLISRDSEDKSQKTKEDAQNKQWQLTMKLDIGEQGELLAKSKITHNTVSINLYTSTSALLTRVTDTLPFLLRKLESLGLEIEKSSVQRGKIPAHLAERPYQLFETKV